MRALLVEDDNILAEFVAKGLGEAGFAVDRAGDAERGLTVALERPPDIVIVDLMLPGADGLTLIDNLRRRGRTLPVLILSARHTVDDRVRGLQAGGDDYLVKPFAFAELLARIRALVRRGRVADAPKLGVGDLEMDLVTRKVLRTGKPVDLTVREFELLEFLMRYQGQVVSRETLARDVWK